MDLEFGVETAFFGYGCDEGEIFLCGGVNKCHKCHKCQINHYNGLLTLMRLVHKCHKCHFFSYYNFHTSCNVRIGFEVGLWGWVEAIRAIGAKSLSHFTLCLWGRLEHLWGGAQ